MAVGVLPQRARRGGRRRPGAADDPSPKRQSVRLDLPGAVTASAGLGLLVSGLSRAADHGWTSLLTAGPLALGAAGLAAFVLLERRSAQPLTPLWVFASRNRGGAYLIQTLVGAALFGMFLPHHLVPLARPGLQPPRGRRRVRARHRGHDGRRRRHVTAGQPDRGAPPRRGRHHDRRGGHVVAQPPAPARPAT